MIFRGSITHESVLFQVFETDKNEVVLQRMSYSSHKAEERKQMSLAQFGALVDLSVISLEDLTQEFAQRVKESEYK